MMVPNWRFVRCPVVIIHGKRDNLVPFGNVAFAEKHLDPSSTKYITHDGARHFIPWEQPEMITDGVLLLLDELKKRNQIGLEPMTAATDSTELNETFR